MKTIQITVEVDGVVVDRAFLNDEIVAALATHAEHVRLLRTAWNPAGLPAVALAEALDEARHEVDGAWPCEVAGCSVCQVRP